ncbi:hypothetical protein K9M74_01510 [Candidatus Woesearchaeota archaeon]|nr:hypothetical protein [Candidatus Woesearchaeota archaeon]
MKMDMFTAKVFENKTDYVKHFGKDLGWKIEETEFANIGSLPKQIAGYQTADETNEDAYPQPVSRYRLVVEKYNASLEETYHWILQFLRHDLGYQHVEKIYDIFSASESSGTFGNMGQRLAIQQDRAREYLIQIGALVKQLFQIVRELRIIDERMEPYTMWKTSKSADITLKNLYINLVENPNGQNPDSIYALARQHNFVVLPDLFMNTHIYKLEDIDKEVEEGSVKEFNNMVKTVLKRKLYQYINWKEKSEKELISRRAFQLKYLRQHWSVIKLYMSWIKPYLKSAARLTPNQNQLDSADLVTAFDNTILEVEVLARKSINMTKKDKHFKCILVNFKYNSKPVLTYKPEYQQQITSHTGKVTVTFRSYGWHVDDIQAYKKMRQEEDIGMLNSLTGHVMGSFEALGEEFEKYLEEAGEEEALKKKEEREQKAKEAEESAKETRKNHNKFAKWGILEPFLEAGGGIGDLFGSLAGSEARKFEKEKKQKEKKDSTTDRNAGKLAKAAKDVGLDMQILFNVYKKGHRHLNW